MDVEQALRQVEQAAAENHLSPGAVENIRLWLTQPRYADYAAQVRQHIADGRWQDLDDAFWTIIPFGTGGRRGRMYPIGSNTINERTIGESAQGLATYVKENTSAQPLACAIAYDTRHNSVEFSRLCAEVMVASGFRVYYLNGHRSTPELSFLVRWKQCACGIMVTASHNPPSDNAVKAYWSTGGQLLPPHDQGVIDRVMSVDTIQRVDFDQAVADGQIVMCQEETDAAFLKELQAQILPGPRDIRIIYSPLHGVGATAVCPILEADGFTDVEVFGPHAQPDGNFPNVPDHVSNPENPEVFDSIVQRARETGAELIMATDPDCDRLGCAAPVTTDVAGQWRTFSGNQIGALLTDYVLRQKKNAGQLTADHYLVKTLVTTEMIRRIGDSYGVKTYGNLLVGFKWIGGTMDDVGPDRFVLGAEESHGYLVGQYARDKDGAVAAMLLAELAAVTKAEEKSLHEKLSALYWQHGYHAEQLATQRMTGSEGMTRMIALMDRFRNAPPPTIGGLDVRRVRDYQNGQQLLADGSRQPLAGPIGDMVILDLAEEGNYVAVRPSGTEPKVKFYSFAYVPAEHLADLDETRAAIQMRLDQLESDLAEFAESV